MSLLEVKNITKSFGKTSVLKGIDFSLEKGKVLSIIGSSGSGKTTLLRCLNFLEEPDTGTIAINDKVIYNAENKKKIKDNDLRALRLHFGLVFQSFNLFPQYNVIENITLAPKLRLDEERLSPAQKKERIEEINNKAIELLKKVGLTEKANSYPCQLSGGQQQRVAIARALALSPDILCFDEPTSALDPVSEYEIYSSFNTITGDKTAIYISHRLASCRFCDNIVVFDNGSIIQHGNHKSLLFDKNGKYYELWNAQAQYYTK